MDVKKDLIAMIEEHLEVAKNAQIEGFDTLKEYLDNSNRIFISAAGRSFLQMKGFAMRLMHIDYDVVIVGEVTTPSIKENDLLIVGSGSGETFGILTQLRKAKKIGAKTFVITQSPNSSMAKEADGAIILPKINSIQHGGSQIEQFLGLTLDAFIMGMMNERGLDVNHIMINHANLE